MNSSSSEEVIFHCDELKCPLYNVYAYDIYDRSKHSVSTNAAVTEIKITLCKAKQSM